MNKIIPPDEVQWLGPKTDHAPAELDEASKRLLAAAAHIEKYGWWQMQCDFGYPAACAALSIMRCWGDEKRCSPSTDEAMNRLSAALGGVGPLTVYDWNDAPGRTKEEVVAKLRAVALGL